MPVFSTVASLTAEIGFHLFRCLGHHGTGANGQGQIGAVVGGDDIADAVDQGPLAADFVQTGEIKHGRTLSQLGSMLQCGPHGFEGAALLEGEYQDAGQNGAAHGGDQEGHHIGVKAMEPATTPIKATATG